MFKLLLAAVGVMLAVAPVHVMAEPAPGSTITISLSEYEKLKDQVEGAEKKQYWRMTFEQILEKEGGQEIRALEKYDYWVRRHVYLRGDVNGSSAKDIASKIDVLNQVGDAPITLYITSPGGGVYEGLTLYNAMMASAAPVNTVCDSMAASMAAVLFSAGRQRTAMPDCHWMIHEVGTGGGPGGQTVEHMKFADRIVDVENMLVDILADNSGLTAKEVRQLMEYETFYDSDEIYRLGFADEVLPGSIVRAARDIPEDLLPKNRMAKNLMDRVSTD